mgnify:CR=1 FL=1
MITSKSARCGLAPDLNGRLAGISRSGYSTQPYGAMKHKLRASFSRGVNDDRVRNKNYF